MPDSEKNLSEIEQLKTHLNFISEIIKKIRETHTVHGYVNTSLRRKDRGLFLEISRKHTNRTLMAIEIPLDT